MIYSSAVRTQGSLNYLKEAHDSFSIHHMLAFGCDDFFLNSL